MDFLTFETSLEHKFRKITEKLIKKAMNGDFLSMEEGKSMLENMSLPSLMFLGHEIRKKIHPDKLVTWIIDRNINITNACISGCKFCNFFQAAGSPRCYITTLEEYIHKIDEMYLLGGRQLLLQGGMHPHLGLSFYQELFSELKKHYPDLRLHALGPPEIVHLATLEKKTYREILQYLVDAGMDSLPGAGAEILSDRVRKILSPAKCNASQWLEVMKTAHQMNLTTSATMMFGHIETLDERLQHLVSLRELQDSKPIGHKGFLSFIPWPFQDKGTILKEKFKVENKVTAHEYIRMIAISRIMLPNISNIQASWLTVGKETAQLCLYAGANDFGSIMMEENVVSVAGANNSFNVAGIQQAINEAGFDPRLRNQDFELLPI